MGAIMSKIRVYRDLTPLMRVTIFCIWTQIIVSVVSLATDVLVLRSHTAPGEQAVDQAVPPMEPNEIMQGLAALTLLLITVVTAVFVLRTIYRADANLHARNVAGLEFTPGWCVGWFFIPIAMLWKPYQAMKEIWVASSDPFQYSVDRPWQFPVWWALFLASNITGTMAWRAGAFSSGLDAQVLSEGLSMASGVLGIPEALFLMTILKQIAAAQERTLKPGDLVQAFA
jgi:hypothetical protein